MSLGILPRDAHRKAIRQALKRSPIVALLGPRQCGKTTLAREVGGTKAHYFDLESSGDRQALSAAPEQTLSGLHGLVVIDEVQTLPELFSVLRVLADRRPGPAQFLILGSSSPDLVRGASETLAGRAAIVYLTGFDVTEVGTPAADVLWQRGGFPRSFLADDDADSYGWRQDFIETFLSRDASRFGIAMPPEQLRRFWTMLAHLHGRLLNAAELGRAISVDQKTAVRYVDILTGAFLVRRLTPRFENAGKRVVKAPKLYIRDSGLLHALLGLRNAQEVRSHPRLGASWEGYAMEQVIGLLGAERDSYFWATHGGAELDLLVVRGGRRHGFEFKFADAPGTTKSMRIAMTDLALEKLWVVFPGKRSYPLDDRIEALALAELPETLSTI
jgi:predicted AAA+ superfamily ATPase